jgi:hypothetical protein
VVIVADMEDGDGKRHSSTEAVYDIEKPNRFALKTKIDGKPQMGPDLICDGKKMFTHAKGRKEYTEEDAAKDLAPITAALPVLRLPSTGLLFQNVLADDPYDALMQGVTSAKYAGTEKVNGTEAHHLKFEQPGLNWELWIAATGKPVVLKALTVLEGDGGAKSKVVETYSNWKIDEAPAKDAFTFSPGAESKKVESFKQE